MYLYIYGYIYVYIYIYGYVYIYIYVCIYVYIWICIYIYIYVCIYVYLYIYIQVDLSGELPQGSLALFHEGSQCAEAQHPGSWEKSSPWGSVSRQVSRVTLQIPPAISSRKEFVSSISRYLINYI